ncbi:SPOSA6832_00930, partial [Sporobolomyces salmonicolor]
MNRLLSVTAPAARLTQLQRHLAPSSTLPSLASAPHLRPSPACSRASIASSGSSSSISSSSPPPSASHPASPSPKAKPARPPPPSSSSYRYFLPFQTRWGDNDRYDHLNNVVYSLYFDSITNQYLRQSPSPSHLSLPQRNSELITTAPATVEHCQIHVPPSPIGLIVSSSTSFASSLSYPSPLIAALSITSLSARTVVWSVALFAAEYVPLACRPGDWTGYEMDGQGEVGRRVRIKRDAEGTEVKAAAWGTMTHVFVDTDTRRPVERLPDELRQMLERLLVKEEQQEQ